MLPMEIAPAPCEIVDSRLQVLPPVPHIRFVRVRINRSPCDRLYLQETASVAILGVRVEIRFSCHKRIDKLRVQPIARRQRLNGLPHLLSRNAGLCRGSRPTTSHEGENDGNGEQDNSPQELTVGRRMQAANKSGRCSAFAREHSTTMVLPAVRARLQIKRHLPHSIAGRRPSGPQAHDHNHPPVFYRSRFF